MADFVPRSIRHQRLSQPAGNRGRQPQSRTPGQRPRPRPAMLAAAQRLAASQPAIRSTPFRLILVWAILVLCALGLSVKLFYLQIIEGPNLQQQAQQQQMVDLRPFVPRRPIIDRLGNVLAIDQPAYTLYAHPKLFPEQPSAPEYASSKDETAAILAKLLGRPKNDLLSRLNSADSGILIEFALSEDIYDQVQALNNNGLELIRHQQRLYPQQDLFADVVGFVDVDRQGQAGVEYSQQNLLERSVQPIRMHRVGDGSLIPDQLPGEFLRQDDLQLQLTLDSRLQRAVRYALTQQVQAFNAKRGAAMVMDVQDGGLLALVSSPSYDPNQYYEVEDLERLRNWLLSDLYEPGSTFKPINLAIALEAGVIQPNDVFNDEGRIEVGGWPIENSDYRERGGRGSLTVTEVLQYSSNVGMVRIMQRLDPRLYYGWLERLGLGQLVGVDLPSENPGQIKSLEQFISSSIEPATTSFGQGFSLTPIQLLQLHGMLANGGRMVSPHVVRGLLNADGQFYWQPDIAPPRQVVSAQTAATVVGMMESAVSEGTGKTAEIPGYRIAGKTGTAQKASPYGGYDANAKITSFVSILPAEAPRYVVLVVMDEPQGDNAFGSTVAAPVAKTVMETLINIERIPPSQPIEPQANANEANTL